MLSCLHLTLPGKQDFPQEENSSPTGNKGSPGMGSGTGIWMAVVSLRDDATLSPGAMHQEHELKASFGKAQKSSQVCFFTL